MNFFQIIPKVLFVDDEDDVEFVKKILNQKGVAFDEIKVGEVIIPIEKSNIYIVKPLDSLQSISKKLNMPIEALKSITGGGHLFIGQKIEF